MNTWIVILLPNSYDYFIFHATLKINCDTLDDAVALIKELNLNMRITSITQIVETTTDTEEDLSF